MVHELTIKRLTGFSFFKLCFIGNTVSFVLLWIMISIPALLGTPIVKWEDDYITGTMTVIAGPLVVVALGLVFSMTQSLFAYCGLLLFSCYKNITLGYLPQKV